MRLFLAIVLMLCGEPYWACLLLIWKVLDP